MIKGIISTLKSTMYLMIRTLNWYISVTNTWSKFQRSSDHIYWTIWFNRNVQTRSTLKKYVNRIEVFISDGEIKGTISEEIDILRHSGGSENQIGK